MNEEARVNLGAVGPVFPLRWSKHFGEDVGRKTLPMCPGRRSRQTPWTAAEKLPQSMTTFTLVSRIPSCTT